MATSILLYLSGAEWLAVESPGGALLGRGALAAIDGPPDWSAFRALAAGHSAGAKIPVRLVIGGERCHFLSLPWSDALLAPEIGNLYAREAFVGLYGAVAEGWTIAVGDAAFGRPRLACATERECLEGLAVLAEEEVIRVESVLPSVTALYAGVRRQLAGEQGVLGFSDGAGFSLLRWEEHEVVSATYLHGTSDVSSVHDWLSRTELDVGPLGAPYWGGVEEGAVPDGWISLSHGAGTAWSSTVAAATVGSR